jgi:hypothetical protein
MYLVNFGLLKNPKLTNDHMEIQIRKKNLIWGPPYGVTIDINIFLLH